MRTQTDDELRAQGKTWEEARWDTLPPKFRDSHNRRRVLKGLPPIPPPKIDRYVPKRGPKPTPFDPNDKEFLAAVRQFNGGSMPGVGAWALDQGFTIEGKEVSFELNDKERRIAKKVQAVAMGELDEGFKVNGRSVR